MDQPDKFQQALAFILEREGGYVEDPDDPGGATKLGISLRYLRTMPEHMADIDGDGDVDADDIRKLTPEQAAAFYLDEFWTPLGLDRVPGRLALILFDHAVNAGKRAAVRVLQHACNRVGLGGEFLAIDGWMGPQTIKAMIRTLHMQDSQHLEDRALLERMAFYTTLAQRKPRLRNFLAGWQNRVVACDAESVAMPLEA